MRMVASLGQVHAQVHSKDFEREGAVTNGEFRDLSDKPDVFLLLGGSIGLSLDRISPSSNIVNEGAALRLVDPSLHGLWRL
jgi:hypothetical protein